jgi:hypothetical protein
LAGQKSGHFQLLLEAGALTRAPRDQDPARHLREAKARGLNGLCHASRIEDSNSELKKLAGKKYLLRSKKNGGGGHTAPSRRRLEPG